MVISPIERAVRMERQRRGASQADTDSDSDPVAKAVAAALAKQEKMFMLLLDTDEIISSVFASICRFCQHENGQFPEGKCA